MRRITAGVLGVLLLTASIAHAANVTLVAPDAFTPIGYDAAHPLFVTGGTGGGGGGTGGSVTQGTSPWVDNISQFGGSPVVTGTGPGGAGIPRFTFSNDSTIANTAFGINGTLPAFATTPTFNIGTLGGAATAANQNSTPAGTSASNGQGVQGVNNGVPLAVTWTGQTVASNLTQLAGTTLGGPSTYGTAPTGQVQGVNAFVSNFPTTQAVTNAGTFAVQNNAATPAGTNSIGSVGLNAGANIVGKVGIDQTTPGVTNGVQVNNLPATQNVQNSNPAAIYSGQQATTTTATALPSQALINGIVVTALTTNTAIVYVGPGGVTTSSGYPLSPGQSASYAVQNASAVNILGTNTADKVAFTGN